MQKAENRQLRSRKRAPSPTRPVIQPPYNVRLYLQIRQRVHPRLETACARESTLLRRAGEMTRSARSVMVPVGPHTREGAKFDPPGAAPSDGVLEAHDIRATDDGAQSE